MFHAAASLAPRDDNSHGRVMARFEVNSTRRYGGRRVLQMSRCVPRATNHAHSNLSSTSHPNGKRKVGKGRKSVFSPKRIMVYCGAAREGKTVKLVTPCST